MNKIGFFLDKWTDLCDLIVGRPVDYVESFALLVITIPFLTAMIAILLQEIWKRRRSRVFIGMMVFVAIWPGFITCGAIYYALGKLFSEKRITFKKILRRGTDTYIRFFERGSLKRKKF